MKVLAAFREGMVELRCHWFRSLLTMAGIVMGTASLFSTLALTEGSVRGFREFIKQTGGDTKGRILRASAPQSQAERAATSRGITYNDALVMRSQGTLFTWVSPLVTMNEERITHGTKESYARGYAAEVEMINSEKLKIAHGRWLHELDLKNKTFVCVLGWKVAKALFDNPASAVGQTVRTKEINWRVIGVAPFFQSESRRRADAVGLNEKQAARRKKRGNDDGEWDPYFWKNNFFAVPLSTYQSALGEADGKRNSDTMSEIQFGFHDLSHMAIAADQAKRLVLAVHRGVEDFQVTTDEQSLKDTEKGVRSQRFTGWLIAGLSLVVGGLGIINIMLASVGDRLREMGVRLAVGARGVDLFRQVLTESLAIAVLGGLAGITAGFGLTELLAFVSPVQNIPVITPVNLLLSLSAAMVIGFLAGLYPAFKAMRIQPIEALKAE